MRLITHNMLRCNVRGVEGGYPLKVEAEKYEVIPSDFDAGMSVRIKFTVAKYDALTYLSSDASCLLHCTTANF